jgi:hypothetical protein
VLTNEMLRNSQAEAIICQTLTEATAASLDALLFLTAPGVPDQQPPGILNGIAPLAAASRLGSSLDAMTEDLLTIATTLAPVSGSGTPILIAAPAQAVSLAMLAPHDVWPIFTSAALPDRTIIGLVPDATYSLSSRADAHGQSCNTQSSAPTPPQRGSLMRPSHGLEHLGRPPGSRDGWPRRSARGLLPRSAATLRVTVGGLDPSDS